MGLFGDLLHISDPRNLNLETLAGVGMIVGGAYTANPALVGAGVGMTSGGVNKSLGEKKAKEQTKKAQEQEFIKTKFSGLMGNKPGDPAAVEQKYTPQRSAIDYGLMGAQFASQNKGLFSGAGTGQEMNFEQPSLQYNSPIQGQNYSLMGQSAPSYDLTQGSNSPSFRYFK